jgi:hypothetical protein
MGLGIAASIQASIFTITDILDFQAKPDRFWATISLVGYCVTLALAVVSMLFAILVGQERWSNFKGDRQRNVGMRANLVLLVMFSLRYRLSHATYLILETQHPIEMYMIFSPFY